MALAGTTQRQCPHTSCFSLPTPYFWGGRQPPASGWPSFPELTTPHLRQEADALTVLWAPGHPRKSPLRHRDSHDLWGGQCCWRSSPARASRGPPLTLQALWRTDHTAHLSLLRPQQKRKPLLQLITQTVSPESSVDSAI